MKIIDVPLDSTFLLSLLTEAKQQNLILRTVDGPEFILAELDNFNQEIELTRQNQELMAFLDDRGRKSKTISATEVKSRLGI